MHTTVRFLSANKQPGGWDMSCFVAGQSDKPNSNISPPKKNSFVSTKGNVCTQDSKALPLETRATSLASISAPSVGSYDRNQLGYNNHMSVNVTIKGNKYYVSWGMIDMLVLKCHSFSKISEGGPMPFIVKRRLGALLCTSKYGRVDIYQTRLPWFDEGCGAGLLAGRLPKACLA